MALAKQENMVYKKRIFMPLVKPGSPNGQRKNVMMKNRFRPLKERQSVKNGQRGLL